MAFHLLFAAMATSLTPAPAPLPVDVAYEELRAGDTQAAIRQLEAAHDVDADDPARLINLGSAYASEGRYAEAETMFRAAIASNQRYRLELADGSWLDSRDAARLALERLQKSRPIAMR